MATELPIRKRTRRRAAASEAAPAATIKHAATAVAEHERAASTEAEGSVTGAAATNALAKKASGKPMSRPRKHAPKASTRIASRATGKPSGSERTTPSHRKRPAAGSRASTIDAVGAFTQLVVEASESTLAANPLLGAESRDVAAAAVSFFKAVTSAPIRVATHYGHYLKVLSEVARGTSDIIPD